MEILNIYLKNIIKFEIIIFSILKLKKHFLIVNIDPDIIAFQINCNWNVFKLYKELKSKIFISLIIKKQFIL